MSKLDNFILLAIQEYASEGIQIVDSDGQYVFCSKSFSEITGLPVSKRIGLNVRDVQPDGACAAVLRTGKAVHGHLNPSRSGQIIVSSAAPIYDETGKIAGVISIFNDKANQMKMLQEIKDKENELASVKNQLRMVSSSNYDFQDLIGQHPAFLKCVERAKMSAKSDVSVLITGESGTGKELLAHAIHGGSERRESPFIKVNCPAIPSNLLESELFGHEKGAFTSAIKTKPGKFELAQNGSIFLDEIGDMDFSLQAKLLRVLQEREVERIGGTKVIPLNVRVISATNQDLTARIREKSFRQDLYYRLNIVNINIPALRQRQSDIPLLMSHLIEKHSYRKASVSISPEAMKVFSSYHWPGNIRELENLIQRMLLYFGGSVISGDDAINLLGCDSSASTSTTLTLAQMEAAAIRKALDRNGRTLLGKKLSAAELGISLSGLYNKLRQYHISE